MANKVPDYMAKRDIPMRSMGHFNSQKKIIDRTKDDNSENEYTAETFRNRKGSHGCVTDEYIDKQPSMIGKKEPKKNKGLRKFKGSKTIRKGSGQYEVEDEDRDFQEELDEMARNDQKKP